MSDTARVFNSYDIQSCLYDQRRVAYLRDAIEATVAPGQVVVDAGSGTGLLGMFAARSGASRVYCVEVNDEYASVIRENAGRNGLGDRIIPISGDATSIELPEPVDVIIGEVISAGFFYEPQLQIVSNLKRFLKPGGRIVPGAVDNYLELIDAEDELYGFRFNFDTRFKSLAGDTALTDRVRYLATDFLGDTSGSISEKVRLRGTRSGRANAVRISYEIQFTPDLRGTEPTEFLMNPQIVFLREPVPVAEGAEYDLSIVYESSRSPLHCTIDVRCAAPPASSVTQYTVN